MKNAVLVLALFGFTLSAFAESDKIASTQFDQVVLQKGSLIIKEFFSFGKFNKVEGEIAVVTNNSTNSRTFALRMTTSYYNSQYDTGETSAVLDAAELGSAISALDYMIQKIKELKPDSPYTEVIFRGNGDPEFGFFAEGTKRKGFLTVNRKASVYFEVDQLEVLKLFFVAARNKVKDLGGAI